MSGRKIVTKLILGFILSIVLTILVETLSSKIINYAEWARVLTSVVYFSMFNAIIADAGHALSKEALRYNEYHKVSLKWELSFVVGFFFMTLIINDIIVQNYENLFVYFVILAFSFVHTVYFAKKLKSTV